MWSYLCEHPGWFFLIALAGFGGSYGVIMGYYEFVKRRYGEEGDRIAHLIADKYYVPHLGMMGGMGVAVLFMLVFHYLFRGLAAFLRAASGLVLKEMGGATESWFAAFGIMLGFPFMIVGMILDFLTFPLQLLAIKLLWPRAKRKIRTDEVKRRLKGQRPWEKLRNRLLRGVR